jgi:hypothetical protein
VIAIRTAEAVYWLTDAGQRALTCGDSGLPVHYRRILAAIQGPSEVAAIGAAAGGCDERRLAAWLDELATLGFVQTAHAAAAYYLKAA